MAGTDFGQQARNKAATERAAKNLGKVLAQIGVGGKDGLADVGVEATNAVKKLLSQPGRGRIYRRRRVAHRASAPNQAPAVDTGRLRASYTWRTGDGVDGPYVEIGTNVKYAPFLEFGTRRMRPRPHLRPGINAIRKTIQSLIADGVIQAETAEIGRLPPEVQA